MSSVEYHIHICPTIGKTVKNEVEFDKIYNGHISDQVKDIICVICWLFSYWFINNIF